MVKHHQTIGKEEGYKKLVDELGKPYLVEALEKLTDSSIIHHLKEDIKSKEEIIINLTNDVKILNEECLILQKRLDQTKNLDKDRIEELEEALRESVRITAEREVALDGETVKRIKAEEEVIITD